MKIKFVRNNAAAIGLAYVKGEIVDLKEEEAQAIIEAGFAVLEKVSDLPKDMPHFNKLQKAGIHSLKSLTELLESGELKNQKGLGEKSVEEIEAFLSPE